VRVIDVAGRAWRGRRQLSWAGPPGREALALARWPGCNGPAAPGVIRLRDCSPRRAPAHPPGPGLCDVPGHTASLVRVAGSRPEEGAAMTTPETGSPGPVLQEAARELEAAAHDAQVAFDCIALGELDRAHTNAITARAAADAAVTALQAALEQASEATGR
jgi:hypothetical protein